jgi:hypothetical protein
LHHDILQVTPLVARLWSSRHIFKRIQLPLISLTLASFKAALVYTKHDANQWCFKIPPVFEGF